MKLEGDVSNWTKDKEQLENQEAIKSTPTPQKEEVSKYEIDSKRILTELESAQNTIKSEYSKRQMKELSDCLIWVQMAIKSLN